MPVGRNSRIQLRVPNSRRAGIRLVNLTDFTGGLNLTSGQFRIAENESPDLLNVDLGQRGGFMLRRSAQKLNSTALADDPRSCWIFRTTSGTNQLMVNVGNDALYSTGGNFTACGMSGSISGAMRAATFNDKCYIQRNAEQVAVRWDGATDTELTESGPLDWQDDLAAPDGDHMPTAKVIASHGGYLWVGNTVEDGTAYPSRLRWSHPNRPEDWREVDYIDVDVGADGDEITALVPYADHLLVFKERSIHAVFGYDPDSFQVVAVDRSRGTMHQDSVVHTPLGVFFFHWPEGAYLYDGKKGGRWIFEKLYPAIRDGSIPSAYRSQIMLGWGGGRLWVSVPWDASTSRARTFVLDPSLGTRNDIGGWTAYDLPTGPYAEWVTSTVTMFVAGCVGSDRMVKLDQSGTADDFGAGEVPYESYFTTAWVDGGQPAVRKRWKRAEAVLHQEGSDLNLTARVYRDYDPTNWYKEFEFDLSPVDTMLWDDDNWDDSEWSADGDSNIIDRGSNLGGARAVSLRLSPPTDINWGVEALVLKYFPRTVRS